MTTFRTEAAFEEALVTILTTKGWAKEIIYNATEADLIRNWANILYENNKGIDRLNDVPLTDSEMQQILTQIQALRTPLKLNGFINGKTVSIVRDNPKDELHLGKEVSLKIYDRQEIAGGQSRYQIVRQPRYPRKKDLTGDRRGDVLLLINGMPLIHLELKRSGVDISQASTQIEKYSYEGHFTGLFSLIQIFVAMTPEDAKYFANPGVDGKFNKDYFFRWGNANNEPVLDWREVASKLLSIPMAHQLIGFYTVADNSDGVLKVMRSYQYFAASGISTRVAKIDWKRPNTRGGYVWHTTGSGKTMTSFKSAQLIAISKDADKVVFLMDRIELGTQSLREYRSFADENQSVQATEDTRVLINKLKSNDPADTLIVTSIQKMSNIESDEDGLQSADLELMRKKRVVIIIDEAHRTVFGETMLPAIRAVLPRAVLFGFTGTPIHQENSRKDLDTTAIFGDEIHRYSLADGIRDKNVLGFDPYKIMTYPDSDIREAVALREANASSIDEVLGDPEKEKIYYHFMDSSKVKMAGDYDASGKYVRGIEDYLPNSQYNRHDHRLAVVSDIKKNWKRLSRGSQFHAIFATSSITEAILYYQLFKAEFPSLKVSALFDPNVDNNEGFEFKLEGLQEIIGDYNAQYKKTFTIPSHDKFKKDLANRLAHKRPYERVHLQPEEQLDLLIVVDQMLTGFDSKWVNTLYLDKRLEYENIIQAFSRTNRLFGIEKQFGTIRYYRLPHTMERNIERAVKLYSGDKPFGLFVDHLDENLNRINFLFNEISLLFNHAGIEDFSRLPDALDERGRFAKLFRQMTQVLESAKIQGFKWSKLPDLKSMSKVEVLLDEPTYHILLMRYKELFTELPGGGGGDDIDDVPFEIDTQIMEINTGMIDAEYMQGRFVKYLKTLEQKDVTPEQQQEILDDLHKSFAVLSQEEQKYANIFLSDVLSGNAILSPDKTFKDYINDYLYHAKNNQVRQLVDAIGVNAELLEAMMNLDVNDLNINEFGRFDALKATVDKEKAKAYFEAKEGTSLPAFRVSIKVDNLLKDFIMNDGFELDFSPYKAMPGTNLYSDPFADLAKGLVAERVDYGQEEFDIEKADVFEVLKSDAETLYLPIKQEYFDAIVEGTKKAEYREIKTTTANKYLLRDETGSFIVNPDVADTSKDFYIDDYNAGKFPFQPKTYKRLYLAVGYDKERDTCIVEVESVSFIPNMVRANLYAFWQIAYNLGKVIEVRRKKR